MAARCTPRHMVSYHGEFYAAGEEIEIDPADVDIMSAYGPVEFDGDGPEVRDGPRAAEGPGTPPPRRRRRA